MIFVKIESIDVDVEFHEEAECDSRGWEGVDELGHLVAEGSINSSIYCLCHWAQWLGNV